MLEAFTDVVTFVNIKVRSTLMHCHARDSERDTPINGLSRLRQVSWLVLCVCMPVSKGENIYSSHHGRSSRA